MTKIPSLLERGFRFKSRVLATIKDYLKCVSPAISASSFGQHDKSFTDQFTDLVQKIDDFKYKCQHPRPAAYRPRYMYKGKIKKDIKWRPISEVDLLLQQNTQPEPDQASRRKFCLLVGYVGTNYMGSQRLWKAYDNTIEEMVLSALLKNNWISQLQYRYPHRLSFESASRTDKGVSAARQCFSLFAPPEIVDNFAVLNQSLPADIRIFDVQQVTKGFSPRTSANARTYLYTLPTIAFNHHKDRIPLHEYRIAAGHLELVNATLQAYKGVKNFHNFTVETTKATDHSALRVMEHLECGPAFVRDGVEFAIIRIRGRSFVMHQIRKMIGLLLAVVRGVVDADVFERALSPNTVDIPTAPGLGLMLDQVHYDIYNRGVMKRKIPIGPLIWDGAEMEINQFSDTFIHPAIIRREIDEASMVTWVNELLTFNYDIVPEEEIDEVAGRR